MVARFERVLRLPGSWFFWGVLFGAGLACDTEAPAQATYTNPVFAEDFPDPYVLRVRGQYYAFSTNARAMNIPVLGSDDLARWEPVGDALPHLPAWAAADRGLTWAPAVIRRGGQFILYYTARYTRAGLQCLSVAISERPEGPYTDDSTEPFVCQTELGGSIDPSPFEDADGTLYLLWKNDGNCCGLPVGLWVQQLSGDGRALIGDPVELLRHDQDWERPLIEGPSMWKEDSTYFLLYSANWYESEDYAVGYAVCGSVSGPCVKPRDEPFFSSSAAAKGPGGQEFFTDADGDLWIAYHAWTAPHVGYASGGQRSLRIDPVAFVDGAPVVAGPTTTSQPLLNAAKVGIDK